MGVGAVRQDGKVPIELVTGPANAGKANVVLSAARARAARGREPLLVVPTRADQARYRRELAERGAVLGVRVERFRGLLAEIVRRSNLRTQTISSLGREQLVAQIAAVPPGTARALARLIGELRAQRVTPVRLRGALRAWESSELSQRQGSSAQIGLFDGATTATGEWGTLELVCSAYERYDAALAEVALIDPELLVVRALDRLRQNPSLWGETPLLVYGFDDLSPLQLDAIETLGEVVAAEVTVSLAYEPGRLVFAGRAATFQRLAPLATVHEPLSARPDYYHPESRAALHHLERSLLEQEPQRMAPGRAVRLLEGESPRGELELIAVEVRELMEQGVAPEEIAIVHRSPAAISALLGEVLSARAIPYALRSRLAFADTAIGRGALGAARCALGGGSLADLLAWLRTPGMLERPELADWLEAAARRRGAHSADAARALWEAERWPLERIDRLRAASLSGFAAFASALLAELERLFSAPRQATAALLERHELDEAQALDAARSAIDQMRELARSAGNGPTHTDAGVVSLGFEPVELVALLARLELEVDEGVARDCVTVCDPLSLRARRVRVLFLCGLQEGVFPAPSTPPLVVDEQRRALARASGLVLQGQPDSLAAERYLLYALVSRPEQALTLSWHAAAEDGSPRARSLFVEDVCDLFEHSLAEQTIRRETLAVGLGPAASRRAGVHETIQSLSDEHVLGELRERRLWSASSLELWASCPVRWFVERWLGGEDLEPTSEPLASGSLKHAALKTCLERLREQTGSARITPASLPTVRRLLVEALAELADSFATAGSPHRVLAARRRLHVDLDRYLCLAAESCGDLEPTHLELEFGFDADQLPPLDIGEGVLLRGRIDRVDVGETGEAVVYDYKGRSAPPGARWLRDGSWQLALYMRAVQRLLGLRPAGGFYQPLAGTDIKARGVLDRESGVELDCVRTDLVEPEDLQRLLDDCEMAAREAAQEARAGALEPRPATCAYGGGCAYPAICRCER